MSNKSCSNMKSIGMYSIKIHIDFFRLVSQNKSSINLFTGTFDSPSLIAAACKAVTTNRVLNKKHLKNLTFDLFMTLHRCCDAHVLEPDKNKETNDRLLSLHRYYKYELYFHLFSIFCSYFFSNQ